MYQIKMTSEKRFGKTLWTFSCNGNMWGQMFGNKREATIQKGHYEERLQKILAEREAEAQNA